MTAETGRSEPTSYNVLFVCTGNTCRSPMAEALTRLEIERRGWRNVETKSAGVAANVGSPAAPEAAEVIRELGGDLSTHRSAPLDPALVGWADLILAMSPSHLPLIEDLGGGHKAALLGDFVAGAEGAGEPVPDPYGGGVAVYRSTVHELRRLVAAALDRITAIVKP